LPEELTEELVVQTAAGMRALGARLAGMLREGDLVLLTGPLGAGKTTLVRGLGEALGVRGQVTSPTFVIARVHPSLSGGPGLVHADAYRLGSLAEMDDLDLDLDGSVTVVEWGEGLAEGLSADRLEITIAFAGRKAGRATGGETGSEADREVGSAAGSEVGEVDEPRTVRITRLGLRWNATEATKPVDKPDLADPDVAGTHSVRPA
jgi:tRNA threonylcarbamoyladenosine biosynthesis protein TsaE